ncbi:PAS domain-containing protein [bacterium]|nr:PAS domain-containing protein [bacterium]
MTAQERNITIQELKAENEKLRQRIERLERADKERARLEGALQDSESFNFALFHYNPIETVVVDREGHVTGYNLAKRNSENRLPVIGEVMYKDYAAKHEIDMYRELMRCIENGEARQFAEQKYEDRFLCINISPFPNGAIITSQDITERKRAEDALLKSEKEKHLILSSVTEVVLYLDRDFRIIWANRAAADVLGMSTDDLKGRHCYEVWQNTPKPCSDCPMHAVLETGEMHQFEKDTPNGLSWSRMGYPVMDDSGAVIGLVQVMLDITKRKHAEKEKNKIQEQLLHVQKMEAIGTLAGGIAHDFNNLLTAIRGSLDLALEMTEKNNPIFDELEEIHIATLGATDLTRQLLLFSRKHLTRFRYIDLNKLITGLLKMLHRLIGEDISIVTDLESRLWTVHGDPGTLEQIILNLTINARDAMPEGGQITIQTDTVHLADIDCEMIPEAYPGDFVRLSVSDTGVGIGKDIIGRIFEPFFSTKGPRKGTGLGLSVVYGIVKDHKGWINVYSEGGKGSVFRIYLPGNNAKIQEEAAPVVSVKNLKGNNQRILLIEDERCVREFTSRALERNGYQVFVAKTAEEAFHLFRDKKDEINLVLSDVVLPDLNGVQLIDQLQMQKPGLKALLTSGYTDSKSQWSEIQKKKIPFLQKPYALTDLLQTIAVLFAKQEAEQE